LAIDRPPTVTVTGMADPVVRQEFAAATAVVVRDGDAGLEVLMLQRSDHGQFANMWVFPGGRVDDDDAGDDEIERARTAATREASEEVNLQLDPATMVAWSHWSPPVIVPKRFLTWFFVSLWRGDEPVVDGHEIVGYQWTSAAAAADSLRPIAPPTFVTLTQLSAHPTWQSIVDNRSHVVERFVTRASTTGPSVLLWAGDSNYESGDPDNGAELHRLLSPREGPMRYLRGPAPQ